MEKNARVVLMKCKETAKLSGIRVEEREDAWYYTWAFPIKENSASREGYENTSISGTFYTDDSYNGCPYCKSIGFVQCGNCNKNTCWNGERTFRCQWCGNSGEVGGTITRMDMNGNF